MHRLRSQAGAKIITIIWLLTAASAMVVTVIYFGRLERMYAALEESEAASSVNTASAAGTAGESGLSSGAGNDGSGQSTAAAAGQEEGSADIPQTDIAADSAAADASGQQDGTEEALTADSSGEQGDTASAVEDTSEHPYYYDSSIDPSKPIIALSFDDGPSIYTERILAALEQYGVKATFFMVGYNVEKYPERVKMVYDAGCEIGNHTMDHVSLATDDEEEILSQIYDNEKLINSIVPAGELIIRPPYGSYNDTTKRLAGRPLFNWSVDSLDWKTRNADSIVAEIKTNAQDGYIVLMHDLYESTAEAAERIIPWLLDQGYQITCISNMYDARGEERLPGHIYRHTSPAPESSTEQ